MFRLTDFSSALPRSAWTDQDANIHQAVSVKPEGGWRLVDYVSGDIQGRALQTSCHDSCEITLPLAAEGWHAISIAMAGHYDQSLIEIRLNGEDVWQTLRAGHGDIQEIPWRFVDLEHNSIQIRYPRDIKQIAGRLRGQAISSRIFWIRLEPMKNEHVTVLDKPSNKPLIYLNDGHSLFWWDSEEANKESVRQSIGRFANSEWQTCCFCNGGADLVNYPSRLGTRFGQNGWDDPLVKNHKTAELIQELIDQGQDVLQLATEQAVQQQHNFWFYIRPQAWVGEPPFDHAFRSHFFSQHPEYRCLNQQGKPLGKLSYAFAEVRAHINGIIQEGLDRGAHAVGIALVRSCPLVYFEQPVLQRFQLRHGKNSLPENADDPRLKAIWNDFLCDWLLEIRALLNEEQRLFLIVADSKEWNNNFGIDLPMLYRDGLVDDILFYPEDEKDTELNKLVDWIKSEAGQKESQKVINIIPGLGNFRDHGMSIAELQKRALAYYRQGADGLNRWDASGSLIGLHLHQPDYLALWQDHYLGEQSCLLQEYAGLYLDEYPPLDGF